MRRINMPIGFTILSVLKHKRLRWRSAIMLGVMASVQIPIVQAQPTAKVPRIGILSTFSQSSIAARAEGFHQGLRELGYVEGKNIVLEWRSAEGNNDRMPALAAELVGLKVDVLVSPGPSATRVFKEATSTIPIVMAQDTDPVGSGFVASLARPGGNITGLATLAAEIGGKQ